MPPQANSSHTIIAFFNLLGFISFAIVQPTQCAVCTYNQPDETTGRLDLKLGTSWGDVWQAIQLGRFDYDSVDWRLVGLIRRDEPDRDKMMRAQSDGNLIDREWSADAMRAEWEKADLNIEISGKLKITTFTDPTKFESAGGWHLVKDVIDKITGQVTTDVKFQVLSDSKINVDYTISCVHKTKSEADSIADRVLVLGDLTTVSFKKAMRNLPGVNNFKITADDIKDVESKVSPTITRHAVGLAQAATINLQLNGQTVIDGTAGFAAKVVIKRDWRSQKIAILQQLGNSISQESHNIVYSTVGQGGAEHDDKTNLSDKDTIYVSATQKAATINLQLGGQTVIDGTAGFAAKVNIQGCWADTKAAILKQLENSISQRSHNILYSTVSQRGSKHDDVTNLSDKDTIYVSATQKVFAGSGNSTDGAKEEKETKGRLVELERASVKIAAVKFSVVLVISVGVGSIVVATIAVWYWYRRHQKHLREVELERTQGTW